MQLIRRFDPDIHHRRTIRLRGFDYASPGAYFVTLCARRGSNFFGTVEKGLMNLNQFGRIVEYTWHDLPNHNPHVLLDVFVIMPDHFHGIIIIRENDIVGAGSEPAPTINPKRHGLPEIIRQFKTFSACRINEFRGSFRKPVWQRNYYEHIIRNGNDLNRIRNYINDNPGNYKD